MYIFILKFYFAIDTHLLVLGDNTWNNFFMAENLFFITENYYVSIKKNIKVTDATAHRK